MTTEKEVPSVKGSVLYVYEVPAKIFIVTTLYWLLIAGML